MHKIQLMIAQQRNLLFIGSLLMGLSILFGAFGAHGLEGKISPEKIASFEVGVRYQTYHALGLLLLGVVFPSLPFSLKWVTRLMLTGIIFFSGSIYILALQDLAGMNISKIVGPITPIGGLLLILSWFVFGYKLMQQKK